MQATKVIQVSTLSDSFEFEMFRSGEGMAMFESFEAYVSRVILPVIRSDMPEITTIRCAASGFPIATIDSDELEEMITHAIHMLKLNRFDDLLKHITTRDVIEGLESLLDHMSIRVALIARVAPSLTYSNGTPAIAALTPERQLAILLNQFLFDAGQFRDKAVSMEDQLQRNRKSFACADVVRSLWGDEPVLTDIRLALIELDAKYRIATLKFNRKELERLTALREASSLDPREILDLIMHIIGWRDAHVELDVSPRWTQKVYAREGITSAERIKYSNLVAPKDDTSPKGAAQRKPSGSTGPLTEEAKAKLHENKVKHDQKDLLKSLLSDAFKGLIG